MCTKINGINRAEERGNNQDFNQFFFSAHSYKLWYGSDSVFLFYVFIFRFSDPWSFYYTFNHIMCVWTLCINCDDVLIFIPFYYIYLHHRHTLLYHSLNISLVSFLYDFYIIFILFSSFSLLSNVSFLLFTHSFYFIIWTVSSIIFMRCACVVKGRLLFLLWLSFFLLYFISGL